MKRIKAIILVMSMLACSIPVAFAAPSQNTAAINEPMSQGVEDVTDNVKVDNNVDVNEATEVLPQDVIYGEVDVNKTIPYLGSNLALVYDGYNNANDTQIHVYVKKTTNIGDITFTMIHADGSKNYQVKAEGGTASFKLNKGEHYEIYAQAKNSSGSASFHVYSTR